jgi:hypothetical protein
METKFANKDFITLLNILIIKNEELRVIYEMDNFIEHSFVKIYRVKDGLYCGEISFKDSKDYFK